MFLMTYLTNLTKNWTNVYDWVSLKKKLWWQSFYVDDRNHLNIEISQKMCIEFFFYYVRGNQR